MSAPRRRARAALALCAFLAACGAPGFEDYTEEPGRYDLLGEVELDVLARARALAADGRLEPARRGVATLCAARPESLVAACLLQELDLDLLARGEPVEGADPALAREDPRAALYARDAARAEAEPTAAALVLAARVAPDPPSAEAWLARAIAADPRCVWAHYGLAWNHARARRFDPAWKSLERALDLDPGHPPSRRLEAALIARSGDVERATEAYEAWIERYAGDPRIAPGDVAGARVDLALLLVQGGEPAAALPVLDAVDAQLLASPARAALVRVAALDALGREQAALDEARRAAALAPDDPMPRVYVAILLESRFDDDAGARAAWDEVLRVLEAERGLAEGEDPAAAELSGLLLALQARAALAKLPAAPEP